MNKADKDQLIQYLKKAQNKGINRVYLHWTAGNYNQVFKDYHVCIKGDGTAWFTTDDLAAVLAHTWKRNTGAIGISLCCCYDAQFPHQLGTCPPTPQQIEVTAQILAIISRELGIPIEDKYIMTHAEIAVVDGYGPYSGDPDTKWDLYQLKDYDEQWKAGGFVLRGKAKFYKEFGDV